MTRKVAFRIALVAALLALVVVPSAALAGKGGPGKGGGGSTSSLSLVLLDSPDSVANRGERITFDVSTTATDRPFVGVRCWQGSTWMYDGYIGFFPTYMFDPWLTLDSPYWASGVEANCTARLFWYDRRGNEKLLATLSFTAAP